MGTSRITRRRVLVTAAGLGALGVAPGAGAVFAAPTDNARYRWDLVNIGFGGTICATAGGDASAFAIDDSKITVTGSGTFVSSPANPQAVSGGGTWETSGPAGTGSGTYRVTGLVDWKRAEGTLPVPDCIGGGTPSAGLATLRVAYDDGNEGFLTVSCHLMGTDDSVFEGIIASKGFTTYWRPDAPVGGVEGNRTLFHRLG